MTQVSGNNWSCTVCTFENFSALANCEICGSARRRIGSTSSSTNNKSAASQSPVSSSSSSSPSLKRAFGAASSSASLPPSSSPGLTQSLLCSVGNCVENEGKKIQRKVRQLKELGIELASNELMMLLARNCYSVHAAASEYFEKGWQQQRRSSVPLADTAKATNQQQKEHTTTIQQVIQQLEDQSISPIYRLVGKITTGAYVTRTGVRLQKGQQVEVKAEMGGGTKRPRTSVSNGATPSTGFVRIATLNRMQIGRVNREVENLLFPLLREDLLRIRAVCVDVPATLDVFAPFEVTLVVQVHTKAFRIFEGNHPLFHFSTRLFDALEFVQSGQLNGMFPEGEGQGDDEQIVVCLDDDDGQDEAASASDRIYGSNASKFDSMHDVLEPWAHASEDIAHMFKATTLKQHQKQALTWMLWRENQTQSRPATASDENENSNPFWHRRNLNRRVEDGYFVNFVEKRACLALPPPPEPCLGGILADEMGLGKTLSMISLILYEKWKATDRRRLQATDACRDHNSVHADPPQSSWQPRALRSQTKKQGQTLVVCPLSLLLQWQHEVEARIASTAQLACHVYYGTARDEDSLVGQSDIVLTTYGVLSSEYEKKKTSSYQGALLGRTWMRVILDEAHSIKSRSTTYFNACSALTAEHRWCLTGTPIQNSIDDIYSLLCFLQYKPWCHSAWWQRVIENPNTQNGEAAAMVRLKALLSPILLRRTKNCRDANGKRLVELPPKHVETVTLTFSRQERAFYQAVYGQTQAEFNGFVANGSANKSYMAIFALLLRLRQACDHPYLVLGKEVVDSAAGAEVSSSCEKMESEDDQFSAMQLFFSRQLQQQHKKNKNNVEDANDKDRIDASHLRERPLAKDQPNDTESEDLMTSGLSVFVRNTLLQIEEEGIESQECPICLDVPREPVLTSCAHLLCDQCLEDCCFSQESPMCPVCRAPIERSQCFSLASKTRLNANNGKNSTAVAISQRDESQMYSTKMRQLLRDLEEFRQQQQEQALEDMDHETTGETTSEQPAARSKKKVVVFSQWTHMLDLIVDFLQQHGFNCLRFDGSLVCDERDRVLTRFANDPQVDVLVISLKAGGVGLNLTAASMVILLDPWWNPAVEQQAIDRVHRLGKTEPVIVKKYIVEDTIEQMICTLQKRKEAIMKNVLIVSSTSSSQQQGNQPERLLQMEDLIAFFSRKA